MENRKRLYIKLIIAILVGFISVYFAKVVFSLNVLPSNLSIILIASLLSINMIADLCLFLKGKWIKIVTIVLDSILIFVSSFGIRYGIRTNSFLNDAFNNNTVEITTYDVLVLKSNKANEIKDIKDYTLGYFNKDDNYEKVLNSINDKVRVNPHEYEDVYEPYNDLILGNVDAIVLEDSIIDDLRDFYTDMYDKVKKIYSFEIKNNNENKNNKVNDANSINIFLACSETNTKKISTRSRNDVNIILSINPNTRTLLYTYIPKDYYVDIYNKDAKDTISYAGVFGLDTSIKTIENLLDIKIDYSVKVGLGSVIKLVDTLGGIDITSDIEFVSEELPSWKVIVGTNHMNGTETLAYAREKKAFINVLEHADTKEQVLTGIANKITNSRTILSSYDDILDALSDLYVTDIPREVITNLVKITLKNSKWNIKNQKLSGNKTSLTTYTSPKNKRNVIETNEEYLKNVKENIKKVLEG